MFCKQKINTNSKSSSCSWTQTILIRQLALKVLYAQNHRECFSYTIPKLTQYTFVVMTAHRSIDCETYSPIKWYVLLAQCRCKLTARVTITMTTKWLFMTCGNINRLLNAFHKPMIDHGNFQTRKLSITQI